MASWLRIAFVCSVLVCSACDRSSDLPVLSTVPAFSLIDQNSNAFESPAHLQDTIWVANFIFTNCPGPCPRMSTQMKDVQVAVTGTGIKLVSFSVDPERDTPAVLSAYASRYNARSGTWFFLTGPKENLQHLSKNVFQLGDVGGDLEHSTRFVLIDRKSRVRGFYLSSEQNAITRLIADAKSLLREPS